MSAAVERKVESANRTVIARELEMDRSYLSQLLNGKHDPSLGVASRVARKIGLTLDEFAGYLEQRKSVVLN